MGKPVEAFSRSWLELREPVDHRSRAGDLTSRLRDAWRQRGWTAVLDLGSGTGSNLRYLSPRLAGAQHWTLLDHDAELLKLVGTDKPSVSVTCVQGDLLEVGVPAAAHTHVVTGSALLDLVTEEWLHQVIQTSCRSGCGVYFALSYNGAIRWGGDLDPDDEMIRGAVNAHQRRDQGRQTALGPDATTVADRLLRAEGYHTWRSPSPWTLTHAEAELARALVDGWERAALELARDGVDRIRAWAARRRRTTQDPAMSLSVGHDDLLGLPAPGR